MNIIDNDKLAANVQQLKTVLDEAIDRLARDEVAPLTGEIASVRAIAERLNLSPTEHK